MEVLTTAEILTTAEMERADRLAIAAGTPGFALMMSAGQAVAEAAMDLVEEGPIVVVAGPGNNGGDGFVRRRSWRPVAAKSRSFWCASATPSGRRSLGGEGMEISGTAVQSPGDRQARAIVDALFGAGLDRAVKGEPLEMIEAINANGAPVLAVDLPSGINGTTAAVMGVAVRATETVTFFRRKPAHLLMPGRICCGRVRVADIGIDERVLAEIQPKTFENLPSLWHPTFPVPKIDGHKYDRGHVVVVSGGLAATGAARLAARGSLRTGAGLVTLASPRDALAMNASSLLAVMVRAVDTPIEFGEMLSDKRLNASVIGPGAGVGERTRNFVTTALLARRRLVLDADALTSFADAPDRLFEAIKALPEPQVVLTPHEGEFPRLFSDISNKHPFRSKLERVRAAAERSGAVVLLKGPDTVIASPDGRATITANAPPWLATAGAGDVLSGMISGLLAQGVPAFEAASMGAWMHGEAASEAGPGLIAEDLPETLPAVMRRLYDEFGIDY